MSHRNFDAVNHVVKIRDEGEQTKYLVIYNNGIATELVSSMEDEYESGPIDLTVAHRLLRERFLACSRALREVKKGMALLKW